MIKKWSPCFGLMLALWCTSVLAAENTVLMRGAAGVVVTADDVVADAQRLPTEQRKDVLTNPNLVLQIAHNLYLKRALAGLAVKDKLDEKNRGILTLAREKMLSELYLIQVEGDEPDAATVDKLCRAQYEVNKGNFIAPETVTARHILISYEKPGAKAKAEELLVKIKAGADFAKLAEENSDDPGSAKKGGLLDAFGRGRTVPDFEAEVFELKKPGDLSEIIKTEFGYHIARLEARKPAGPRSYDDVKDEIRKSVLLGIATNRRRAVADPIAETAVPEDDAIKAFAASIQ